MKEALVGSVSVSSNVAICRYLRIKMKLVKLKAKYAITLPRLTFRSKTVRVIISETHPTYFFVIKTF
jgi:hypothetical protein